MDIEKVQEMLGKSEYIRSLGITITHLEADRITGKMPFDAKYCNPGGTMHGGCLYSLADTVAGTLAYSEGCDVVTVEGGMHFLNATADTSWVYCDAVIRHAGRHIVVVDVSITDDNGKLLDTGSFTYFKTDGAKA